MRHDAKIGGEVVNGEWGRLLVRCFSLAGSLFSEYSILNAQYSTAFLNDLPVCERT
jgi:hypothetical protein